MKKPATMLFAAAAAVQSPAVLAHHEISGATNSEAVFVVFAAAVIVAGWRLLSDRRRV